MPARTKKPAREPVGMARASSTGSEPESEVEIVSNDDDSRDENDDISEEEDSDSDSLDSSAPRKRRRISPEPEEDDKNQIEDEDDEEPLRAPVSFISAPSRIKRNNASDVKKDAPKLKEEVVSQDDDVFGGATTAPTDPSTSFESLGVHPWLVRSLSNMAIRRPTGIQKGCIPEILKGRDCIGGSRTGSGKTVAFAVPILQKWAEDPSAIFAVVLTPTR